MAPRTPGIREANRERTRTSLLDSAEELFAVRGHQAVSVRDITDHAGTRVAAISDVFGGKDQLVREVLLRRIRPINDDRRRRLAALPDDGPRTDRLHALVLAFTEPMMARIDDGPGWSRYFRFVAQLANSAHPVQLLVADEYNGVAAEFIERLAALYPDADSATVHDAYLNMLAATLQVFSANLRVDALTHAAIRSDHFPQRYAALITFVTGGIDALLGGKPR
ncbi:TetR family transcriptional regulator [Gordonia amarae]|uniref:TetR family transcriptional regulator n=2 Tax=Gordonia amarae TaxID=36821 RepID=A0A857MAB4_9ACTN|nr:TetR/AcrR family transcriptional regulator [Gordonia amarae]MCS3877830.1 AcrR family transcriptional regulator [Gordonia amarae]QHN16516.1 TetR family transcriptional regulator [Gordonia amarae]QHN21085.1 TetR family transcriptional regulator [Gordonia amarae]QHN29936.1 TetR family transcriptional regulator [Gordonia amarae]QHN38712.1 TetR family transcriptional regulator [Gordonia amarae]